MRNRFSRFILYFIYYLMLSIGSGRLGRKFILLEGRVRMRGDWCMGLGGERWMMKAQKGGGRLGGGA